MGRAADERREVLAAAERRERPASETKAAQVDRCWKEAPAIGAGRVGLADPKCQAVPAAAEST